MKIISGLFDNCVLQRDANNLCNTKIIGEYGGYGDISCRVNGYHPSDEINFSFNAVTIENSRFSANLKGLPVGGPYTITISVQGQDNNILEETTVKNVLVGDLWILAGQSNMQGIGSIKDGLKPDPLVRTFNLKDNWEDAKDPLHRVHDSIHPIHVKLSNGCPTASHLGVGPGLGFAKHMLNLTNIPQGIIPCAHGGTSMDQWSPEKKSEASNSLYGSMINRLNKIGGKVAGMIWYQGCSDTSAESSPLYTEKMINFVDEVRKVLSNPSLPIVIAQISRVTGGAMDTPKYWNSIQDQQRLLPEKIDKLVTISTIDLDLDDTIHISGSSQNRLGVRFANSMYALTNPKSKIKLPPRLKEVKLVKNKVTSGADIEVTYENVTNKLFSNDRPCGFELSASKDKLDVYRIFSVTLNKNKVILHTTIPYDGYGNGELYLYYGYGIMPYCNIVDEQDYALPVFGPVPVKKE